MANSERRPLQLQVRHFSHCTCTATENMKSGELADFISSYFTFI